MSMREQIARAICEADGYGADPDPQVAREHLREHSPPWFPRKEKWEKLEESVREEWRKQARAALSIAAPILRNEAARDAFMAGFWAWNGPSNKAEFDRDTAMEQEAWEEYAASLKTKDKPE